jgi:hypothetical protein
MRKLSKRSVLKKKKQQLIDRINNNKSLKELKGWERTFSYYDVLKDDFDWDYEFLLDLIEFKLKRMSNYFHTHHIVENEDWYGTLCDRAIAILNAGYKTDIITNDDLKTIHVNDKNMYRFVTKYEINFISKCPQYYYATIREAKAKRLFWKFLDHYIEYLWE